MSTRRHRFADLADGQERPEHQPGRYRGRRTRSWTTEMHATRELALTVQCPRAPRGCGRPIGEMCRNRHGEPLINQPAHMARIALSEAPEPTPGDPAPDATEETT